MKRQTKKKGRRTRHDIEALLGRYHQSGRTVRAFSMAEGVPESSVYMWLRRQRANKPAPALVEVMPAAGVAAGLSVQTPRGYRLELPAGFSVEELKRLLGVLEA